MLKSFYVAAWCDSSCRRHSIIIWIRTALCIASPISFRMQVNGLHRNSSCVCFRERDIVGRIGVNPLLRVYCNTSSLLSYVFVPIPSGLLPAGSVSSEFIRPMRILSFYNTSECDEQSFGAVSFRKGCDASYRDADSIWVNAVRAVPSHCACGEENRRSAECARRSRQ